MTDAEKTSWSGKAEGDHNHDGSYIKQTELNDAVDTALQAAKDSGEFDGDPGYTPIKGKDYWTEADKAAMVADVIAALPVYNGEVTTA